MGGRGRKLCRILIARSVEGGLSYSKSDVDPSALPKARSADGLISCNYAAYCKLGQRG